MSTYQGAQDTFHRRHLTTEYATKVMQMRCTTCHEGSPRATKPPTRPPTTRTVALTLQNGQPRDFLSQVPREDDHEIMGLPGPWNEVKARVYCSLITALL